jgi:long-chain acyl-CoA synthetase
MKPIEQGRGFFMKKAIKFSKDSKHLDPYQIEEDGNLVDFFYAAQKKYSHKPAFSIVLPQGFRKTLTYAEVTNHAMYIRDYLVHELNLQKGDRVALSLPNCLAWPSVVIGVLSAGCVLVNLNPLYQAYEIEQILEDSEAKCLFILDMFAHNVESFVKSPKGKHLKTVVRVSISDLMSFVHQTIVRTAMRLQGRIQRCHYHQESFQKVLMQGHWWHMKHSASVKKLFPGSLLAIRNDSKDNVLSGKDTALLQYTGGTTGTPKAAILTHANLIAQAKQLFDRASHAVRPGEEVVLGALPLYHIFAFSINFVYFFSMGSHQVVVPSPRPISNLQPAFKHFKITWMTGVNTLFAALVHERWFREMPPKALKQCIAGGMGLSPEVAKKWHQITGVHLHEGYGLTETSPVCTSNLFQKAPVIGSIGIPLKNCQLRVVNDKEIVCQPGEVGELRVKGPHVMQGYWKKPEATQEVFDKEGWFRTGDIAKFDDKGYYYIVDRAKDLIIVSGFNVYPMEIEHVIEQMPGVEACGVVGYPCEKTGEQVIAFVQQSANEMKESAVIAYTSTYLTRYKLPSRVFFLEELPKTNVGKILRRELREKAKELLKA